VLVYLCAFFGQTVINTKGLSTTTGVLLLNNPTEVGFIHNKLEDYEKTLLGDVNTERLLKIIKSKITIDFRLKITFFVIFSTTGLFDNLVGTLPIITGLPVIILGIGLLVLSNETYQENLIKLIVFVSIQTVLIRSANGFIGLIDPNLESNTTLSLIAGLILPYLIEKKSKQEKESALLIYAKDRPLKPFLFLVSIILCMMMPGFGTSIIIPTLFAYSKSKEKYTQLIESAVEGICLHKFMVGNSSQKTPLGDILTASPFNYSEKPMGTEFLFIIAAIIAAIILTTLTLRFVTNLSEKVDPKRFIILGLIVQSIITLNLYSFIYIGIGFGLYRLRTQMFGQDEGKDTLGLCFVAPMV
jgi:hypothetical protein